MGVEAGAYGYINTSRDKTDEYRGMVEKADAEIPMPPTFKDMRDNRLARDYRRICSYRQQAQSTGLFDMSLIGGYYAQQRPRYY